MGDVPVEVPTPAAPPPSPWRYVLNSSRCPAKPFTLLSEEDPVSAIEPTTSYPAAMHSLRAGLPVYQRWGSEAWFLLLCSLIISLLRRKGLPRHTPGYACVRGSNCRRSRLPATHNTPTIDTSYPTTNNQTNGGAERPRAILRPITSPTEGRRGSVPVRPKGGSRSGDSRLTWHRARRFGMARGTY